jgi:cobalt-zinc-cadmium efflux system membrane fusion protein
MKIYAIGAALVTFVAALSAAALWYGRPDSAANEQLAETTAANESPAAAVPTHVEFSSDRLAAAGLRLAPVEQRRLQAVRRVPGRIQYDESSHVAIRAPAEGVLIDVLVQPADAVTEGQTLARLASREIGEARSDVLRRQEELKLAEAVLARHEEILSNVGQLAPLLEERKALEEIEKQFDGRTLGPYRETLVAAYSRFLLAEEVFTQGQTVTGGALAGVVQRQRRGEWETAHAAFQAALEAARFDTRTERDEARVAADDARRRLEIARHRVKVLTGSDAVDATAELSLVQIISPVSGTIEERRFTRTERVEQSERLFLVADTRTVWVAAAVREKEWQSLSLTPGVELEVQPAGDSEHHAARLLYAGREMAEESHSVPLVAALDNPQGLLRPGMYATVALPIGSPVVALAVRPGAVMQHEGEKFVFVADGPQSFRRVTVETGLDAGEWIEIRSGLSPGMQVVEEGAFVLKSELLLEREE